MSCQRLATAQSRRQCAPAELHEAPKCEVCNAQPSKYRCPGCQARTCSLPCVRQHKEDTGCSGKRDRLAFVPLKEFTDRHLLSGKALDQPRRFPSVSSACTQARHPTHQRFDACMMHAPCLHCKLHAHPALPAFRLHAAGGGQACGGCGAPHAPARTQAAAAARAVIAGVPGVAPRHAPAPHAAGSVHRTHEAHEAEHGCL